MMPDSKPAVPEYTLDPDRTHAVIGQQLMIIDQLRRELETRSTEVNEWHDKYLAAQERLDALVIDDD
jgi:hypothetical protein